MGNLVEQSIDISSMIERARRFEPEAFDAFVDEYAPRVRGFLRRIVRSNDVDDMVQEVFLRVVRTIGRYQESGRFDAWVFQIARNLAHDHLRNHMRRGPNDGIPADWQSHDQSDRVVSELEKAESLSQVESALRRLPDAEREVILLRHFGQLTFEEIAELMGTPLGTALARSHRGLCKLRRDLEESE